MFTPKNDFSTHILHWYKTHARLLPWRISKLPYQIWISEVIMQQTRVDQGLPYYLRFTESFHTVFDLNNASEDDVLRLWQGLGYYSRARNMKTAAKQIVENFNGVFPQDFDQIKSLKGVGSYTAAAIASMAFGLPHAVVDGNVYRVLSRYFDINLPINSNHGIKYFNQLAQELLFTHDPGTYNQAIMEFGALQCKPSNPDCSSCVLATGCLALKNKTIAMRPIKNPGVAVQNRFLNYFLLTDQNSILIQKREENDIWKGLYQLPLLETESNTEAEQILINPFFLGLTQHSTFKINSVTELKHKLTHRQLHLRFFELALNPLPALPYSAVNINQWHQFAFPKPIHHYLKKLFGGP